MPNICTARVRPAMAKEQNNKSLVPASPASHNQAEITLSLARENITMGTADIILRCVWETTELNCHSSRWDATKGPPTTVIIKLPMYLTACGRLQPECCMTSRALSTEIWGSRAAVHSSLSSYELVCLYRVIQHLLSGSEGSNGKFDDLFIATPVCLT